MASSVVEVASSAVEADSRIVAHHLPMAL